MEIFTETLRGEGFETQVTSHRDGGQVVVVAFGRILASWPEEDTVARDVFLAVTQALAWRGKTLAALAFTSESQVSRARARVAKGEFSSLVQRGSPGRERSLTARQQKRVRTMRAAGKTLEAIATQLGASLASVGRQHGSPRPTFHSMS